MPRCKICKVKYEPKYFNQKTCEDWVCMQLWIKKEKERKWKKEKKERLERLKTHKDYVQELQKTFNAFIRQRDKHKPCISCGKPLIGKFDAGHYRSAGGNPELRFDEDNVHGQCVRCNQHLHGNLIDYRIRLIQRIGQDVVDRLEGPQKPKHYTIDQLKGLKTYYKEKTKQLKK